MNRIEILYFAMLMFAALTLLLLWKRRRDGVSERLNKGLQSFVSGNQGRRRVPDLEAALSAADEDALAVE